MLNICNVLVNDTFRVTRIPTLRNAAPTEKLTVNINEDPSKKKRVKEKVKKPAKNGAPDVVPQKVRVKVSKNAALKRVAVDTIRNKALSPKQNLLLLTEHKGIRSPVLGTISANTPIRSSQFYKDLAKVAESSHRVLGKGHFGTIVQATYRGVR